MNKESNASFIPPSASNSHWVCGRTARCAHAERCARFAERPARRRWEVREAGALPSLPSGRRRKCAGPYKGRTKGDTVAPKPTCTAGTNAAQCSHELPNQSKGGRAAKKKAHTCLCQKASSSKSILSRLRQKYIRRCAYEYANSNLCHLPMLGKS